MQDNPGLWQNKGYIWQRYSNFPYEKPYTVQAACIKPLVITELILVCASVLFTD